MTTHTALELSGASLAGLVTVAQIPSGDGLLELVLKTGAVGIIGAICVVLIRENRKTIESIESAHREASEKFERSVERVANSVERMIEHCAAKTGTSEKK